MVACRIQNQIGNVAFNIIYVPSGIARPIPASVRKSVMLDTMVLACSPNGENQLLICHFGVPFKDLMKGCMSPSNLCIWAVIYCPNRREPVSGRYSWIHRGSD